MYNLKDYDFKRHNREVKEIWDAYKKGNPIRVPMVIYMSSRIFLLDPNLNTAGITYKEYFNDPNLMFEYQLRFADWKRHNIMCDMMMGIPKDDDVWYINIDFQNVYEQVWFGTPIYYVDGDVPDTRPILDDDNKYMLFDKGLPEPFSGIMGTIKDYYEFFIKKAENYCYKGAKVSVPKSVPGMSSDGPLTTACNLRGATEFCLDMMEDPEYAHSLLSYITEASIKRIQAWRKYMDLPKLASRWGFADDSIQLISCDLYKEMILPYHKRLVEAVTAPDAYISMHLCGDASRHFKIITEELNVKEFDTGFPIDHGKVVKELGKEVTIYGGPHVEILRSAKPEEVYEEVKRILNSGVKYGGKFILRDANNLAPFTPMENVAAMYKACKTFGRYEYF